MTDSELIKALENSINTYNEKSVYVDTENLQQQVLDLIKRQKADNEALKELDKRLLKTARSERAEAYKEFAEIIKDKWFDNRYDSPDVDFDDFIDDALKELVGDNK